MTQHFWDFHVLSFTSFCLWQHFWDFHVLSLTSFCLWQHFWDFHVLSLTSICLWRSTSGTFMYFHYFHLLIAFTLFVYYISILSFIGCNGKRSAVEDDRSAAKQGSIALFADWSLSQRVAVFGWRAFFIGYIILYLLHYYLNVQIIQSLLHRFQNKSQTILIIF